MRQDHEEWVSFRLGDGSSGLGLYFGRALAADAGVEADGTGFRGVAFSYIVRTHERVDEVLAEAERAGGTIARPAQSGPWGRYFGYFADPDRFLWKVVTGAGERSFAE